MRLPGEAPSSGSFGSDGVQEAAMDDYLAVNLDNWNSRVPHEVVPE